MKKSKKIISILAVAFLTMFLTCGIPEKVTTDHWRLYSVWSMGGNKGLIAGLFTLVIIAAIIAQYFNEKNRPNRYKGGKYE